MEGGYAMALIRENALYAFRDPLPRTGKGEVARFQMAQVLEERTDGVKEIKMKGRNV